MKIWETWKWYICYECRWIWIHWRGHLRREIANWHRFQIRIWNCSINQGLQISPSISTPHLCGQNRSSPENHICRIKCSEAEPQEEGHAHSTLEKYVKAKWLSPYTRAIPTLSSHHPEPRPQKDQILVPVGMNNFARSGDENNSVEDTESGDPVFALSSESSVEEENKTVVREWKPPEIKRKIFQTGVKIVTGLASVIEDNPWNFWSFCFSNSEILFSSSFLNFGDQISYVI